MWLSDDSSLTWFKVEQPKNIIQLIFLPSLNVSSLKTEDTNQDNNWNIFSEDMELVVLSSIFRKPIDYSNIDQWK